MIVIDERPSGVPSLSVLPRMTSYEQLKTWVNVEPQSIHGWDIAPVGELVWKLIGFYIQDGPATFVGRFLESDGGGSEGVAVVHSWNGAPSIENPLTPDYDEGTGVVGLTDNTGEVDFPYSGGMVYTGARPWTGLGKMWPLCPQHLSEPKFADAVFGLGWVGGTDHTTINPIFQLVRKSSPPTPGKFSLALFQDGVDLGVRLVFTENSSGQGYELVLYDDNNQRLGKVRFE